MSSEFYSSRIPCAIVWLSNAISFRSDMQHEYIERVCPHYRDLNALVGPRRCGLAQLADKTPGIALYVLESAGEAAAISAGFDGNAGVRAFTLIVGAIEKFRLKQRYEIPPNPYALALTFCMEQVYAFMREKGEAERELHFLVEKRGRSEDAELGLVFCRVRDGGSCWESFPDFQSNSLTKRPTYRDFKLRTWSARPLDVACCALIKRIELSRWLVGNCGVL